MTAAARKPRKPAGLGTPGTALWASVVEHFDLRPDEVRILTDACWEADLIDRLATGLEGEPLVIEGSKGTLVAHPLLSEVRQHRAVLASLMRQLKLPDDGNAAGAAGERSARARAAANARWAHRGA